MEVGRVEYNLWALETTWHISCKSKLIIIIALLYVIDITLYLLFQPNKKQCDCRMRESILQCNLQVFPYYKCRWVVL